MRGSRNVTEFIQITTTTGARQEAERIAAELVSRRLAGCVQISGPIHSTYRWQGNTETSEEWLCTAKTGRDRLIAIEQLMDELHGYDVPELIATPIVGGSEKYLKWLDEQLG
jgi:periplasmic divalent cation tolerance protein